MPNYRGAPSARRRAEPGGRGRPARRGRGNLSREPPGAGWWCEKQQPQCGVVTPSPLTAWESAGSAAAAPARPLADPGHGRQRMLVFLPPRSSSAHHFSGPFSFPFSLSFPLSLFFFSFLFIKECASGICEYKKVNKRGLVFNFSLPGPRARTKQFPGAAAAPARPRRDPTGSRPALGLLTPVLRSSLVRVSFQQLEAISESPASLISIS